MEHIGFILGVLSGAVVPTLVMLWRVAVWTRVVDETHNKVDMLSEHVDELIVKVAILNDRSSRKD